MAKKQYEVEIAQYRERLKDSFYQVDLTNKIYVFLEPTSIETFKMLKPTLSHDNETIDHKYTDDKGNVHVTRLVGFPACIFNSLDDLYMSEFATRTLTVAPATSQTKIENSKAISSQKVAYPFRYKKESFEQLLIREYIRQIRNVCRQEKLKILVPFPNLDKLFRSREVRDMRDYNHFLELVPAFTLLNLFQRPVLTIDGDNYLVSTIQDVINAKDLYDAISLTTQTGTEKKIIDFYYDCVYVHPKGITKKMLTESYNKKHRSEKAVSSKTIERWLRRLIELEWVDVEEGLQANVHEYTYTPLHGVNDDENQTQLFDGKTSERQGETDKGQTVLSFDLTIFCKNNFNLWLESERQTLLSAHSRIMQINGSFVEISEEQFKEKILHTPSCVCPSKTTPKTGDILEKTVKPKDKQECLSRVSCCLSLENTLQPVPAKVDTMADQLIVNDDNWKPKYYYSHILPAEKCVQCEHFAVEYILKTSASVTERLCHNCFETRRRVLTDAHFILMSVEAA